MASYRIKVESIDGSEVMDEKYIEGIECNGFVIMADCDKKGICATHNMSKMGIAQIILSCDSMMDAAKLAFIFKDVISKYVAEDKQDFLKHVIESLNAD